MHEQLHRVAHGGILHQFHVDAWNNAHVEEVLTQCALSSHGCHPSGLTYIEFF